jgi:hypothetical protein
VLKLIGTKDIHPLLEILFTSQQVVIAALRIPHNFVHLGILKSMLTMSQTKPLGVLQIQAELVGAAQQPTAMLEVQCLFKWEIFSSLRLILRALKPLNRGQVPCMLTTYPTGQPGKYNRAMVS